MIRNAHWIVVAAAVLLYPQSPTQAQATNAVLYDFTATWCGPCQQMNPIVHKLEREGFPIKKVDIDQNPNLARQYRIESIPAFVLVVNGKEVAREVGRTSEFQLRQLLAKAPIQSPQQQPPNHIQQPSPTVIASGNTGYEQPRLGQAAPFPTQPTSQTPQEPVAPSNQMLAQQNTQTGNIWAQQQPVQETPSQNAPIIRAQFDQQNNVTHPTPHVDSQSANVRIRIRDEKGINYGSGTIIDSQPGLTHILTCGHIFRGMTEQTKVDIDLFVEDRFESFVGKVVKYDLDADVGLVSIPTDGVLPVARLAAFPSQLKVSDSVKSVGCNNGQSPTTEMIQVTGFDAFIDIPNTITCSGFPTHGRSGGGLYNQQNEVVGVCMAKDPKKHQGVYAGLQSIVELVSSCGLTRIVRRQTEQTTPNVFAQNQPAQEMPAHATTQEQNSVNPNQDMPFPETTTSNTPAQETVAATPAVDPNLMAQNLATLQAAQGAKLTIIIEKPEAPGQTQVVIIPAATARLIADLTGEVNQQQIVTSNRFSGQSTPVVPVAAPVPQQNGPGLPAQQNQGTETIDDRSQIFPTRFSVAQPYRRVKQ